MSRASCLRRRPPIPVLPPSTTLKLCSDDWAWAICEMGLKPLLGADGCPWHDPKPVNLIGVTFWDYGGILRCIAHYDVPVGDRYLAPDMTFNQIPLVEKQG